MNPPVKATQHEMCDPESSTGTVAAPWEAFTDRQRWSLLAVLFVVSACNYVDRQIIGVVLEGIKAEFAVSDTQLGLLSGLAFALFYATLGIPIARLADRYNRKTIISVSVAVWSGMTVACGLVVNFWQLLLARIGVGAGEAGAIPPAQSLLADYFPPEKRGRALGIFMMASAVGYAVALILGGYIAQHFGWRFALIAAGAFGLVVTPLVHFGLKEPRQRLRTARIVLQDESFSVATRKLFRKKSYAYSVASLIVYFFISYGALVFVVPFMMRIYQLDVAEAGLHYGVIAMISAVAGGLGGGALADYLIKRGRDWSARLPGYGLLLAIPAYEVALAVDNETVMLVLLLVGSIILTAVVPSMFAVLHLVCGSRRRAYAIALMFLLSNIIGLGLGPLLTGVLSDALAGHFGRAEALRYAMMVAMCGLLPASGCMFAAAAHIEKDLES